MTYNNTKRSFPNKSEIDNLISNFHDPIYEDKYGRLYGYIDENHWITKGFKQEGRTGR